MIVRLATNFVWIPGMETEGITGQISVYHWSITCLFLAEVSQKSRTCFAPVSLYRAKQVRNRCETDAKLLRDRHQLSRVHGGRFHLLSLDCIFKMFRGSYYQILQSIGSNPCCCNNALVFIK